MKKVRVRYAPSPTGLLHIGNARSALFNFLFARHFNGDFIIRIEDTDVARNVEGGEKSQLDNLKWLGIKWDESYDVGGDYGPYRQLERLDLYKKYAEILLEKGLAYKDYRENSSNYAIRFKSPENKEYIFDDIVRGTLRFHSKDVEDWIILKDNGIPTYNFAVVVDDHFMEITHVLRGEEHITNTPKQIMVYEAFGWDIPVFGHMTIIVNEERKKLSKRDENVIQFISEYKNLGYLPEAIFNFISLLGWSPKENIEIMTQKEIIENFDPTRLSKSPAMFDKEKLAYINSRYIKMLSIDELAIMAKPYLVEAKIEIESEEWLNRLVSIFQDRMTHIKQIVDLYNEFFSHEFMLSEEALKFLEENDAINLLEEFYRLLENNSFIASELENTIKEAGKNTNTKGRPLFMGLRIATTGEMQGPSLPESLSLLEKDRVLNRLQYSIKKLRGVA